MIGFRVFDERDQAVRALVAQAIQHARGLGRKIGLCGQASSDYPEFARFCIECGIDSISLNPDAVLAITRLIADTDAALHVPAAAAGRPAWRLEDARAVEQIG